MSNPYGLLLCDDLIFTSKVLGTAKALNLEFQSVRSPSTLLELVRKRPPQCVILDLHHPNLDLGALVAELKQATSLVRIVGYGSHVEVETLQNARKAGCDPVWPRSKFVEELPRSLPEWLQENA